MDRDGTINEEVEYLSRPGDVRLIPGAAEAIRLLNEAGVPAIVVTNQAGVGRGYLSEAEVAEIHNELARQLADQGAHLDAIYHCPHRPDDGCDCRKPKPGMLEKAARDFGLALKRCFVMGDKVSDLEAGDRVGCRTVLVLTGYGVESREKFRNYGFEPDFVAEDLLGAVKWVLGENTATLQITDKPTSKRTHRG